MSKTTINATSGRSCNLEARTEPRNGESGQWTVRSYSVTVASSSGKDRMVALNDKLRGNTSRLVSSK
jgi:hypothetical protein